MKYLLVILLLCSCSAPNPKSSGERFYNNIKKKQECGVVVNDTIHIVKRCRENI